MGQEKTYYKAMDTMTWYKKLKKPAWAPKPKVFGIVWSILYPVILASFGFVFFQAYRGNIEWLITLPFTINLIANLIFTPIQFGLKNNSLALFDISIVLLSILWLMLSIWPIYPIIALIQLPYLLWVCIATMLQLQITWLNR